jgi:predicted TIM-barrel enzyme
MSKVYTCAEVNERLRATLREGKPIIIGGAGDGFTAKLQEKGGIDLIGIYNTGKFRHYGASPMCGLLPLSNNNEMVMGYAPEVCAIVKETPVIAGFAAQDPVTIWPEWCAKLTTKGVSGFMNFPTVGVIDGDSRFRRQLDEQGVGFKKECEVLKLMKDLGYFTIGYCFTPEEAVMIAEAGVDILACHVGQTTGGLIGAKSYMRIEDVIKTTTMLIDAAKKARPKLDFIPITHGGLMETPETTIPVLKATEAVGYLGASSLERTPVEPVIIKVCQDFKKMPIAVPKWIKL